VQRRGKRASTPDPNISNNTATGHVSFLAAADLAITKTAPAIAVAGTNFNYVITVTNSGPSVATGVVVKDTIPGQTSVISVSPNSGSCTAGIPGNPLQPLTCTLGNLAPSGSAAITVTVAVGSSVPEGTVINNNATVSSTVIDPSNANNSPSAAVTVRARADLSISKSSDKVTYKPSTVVTYTIAVTNNGPSDALAVTVTDNLPATMQAAYQSDTGGCTKSGLVLTCNLGSMPVGTSKSFIMRELVKGTRGTVSNTASVSSSTADPQRGEQLLNSRSYDRPLRQNANIGEGARPSSKVLRSRMSMRPSNEYGCHENFEGLQQGPLSLITVRSSKALPLGQTYRCRCHPDPSTARWNGKDCQHKP
jgi:uncharacterized repeat protein (TIGR01451 family)